MRINVETSQNVLIDYQLASLGDRILAVVIDGFVIAAYVLLVILLFSATFGGDNFWVIFPFLIPIMLYHLLSELYMDGQSIGKRQMSIKVVRLDGSQPTLANFLLRWLIRPFDMMLNGGVAVLTILITGKGQRLGDMAAGTTVIKIKKKTSLSSKDLIKKSIDEDYQPMFSQVDKLSDRDVQIIKEVLGTYKSSGNHKPILMLADKTKELLGISTDLPAVKLLYTIVKDYNHIVANAG